MCGLHKAERLSAGYRFPGVFRRQSLSAEGASPTPAQGAGKCVCECGKEGWVEVEDSPAKRKASDSAAWRSCQDSAARAATAEAAPRPGGGCEAE